MKRTWLRSTIVILESIVFGSAGGIAAHATINVAYTIVNLGTLGGTFSDAADINASGMVVGYSTFSGDNSEHGFLYDGVLHDLGTLGLGGEAHGINDAGQVTGYYIPNNGVGFPRAFLMDDRMRDIGTLGGGIFGVTFGWSISAAGSVAGDSTTPSGDRHAFLYDGTMHDLGTLGGDFSQSLSINDSEHMVGNSATAGNTATHAFLYDGSMHDLGTLGGRDSQASGINNGDQVVGYSSIVGDAASHAFLYDGAMLDLGTLGGANSFAFDVNDHAHVVGSSETAGGGLPHAFLYTPGNGMIDLNLLIDPLAGWELTSANAINDAGQITGSGIIEGEFRAFLLTPVPEPRGLALAAAALCNLVLGARIRRR